MEFTLDEIELLIEGLDYIEAEIVDAPPEKPDLTGTSGILQDVFNAMHRIA